MISRLDEFINDPQRLATLRQLAIVDSPAEDAYDRLTRLATQILHVPTALVSIVDCDRQFFKSAIGVGEPWASRRGTPLSHSYCKYVVATGQPLITEDARTHPLLHDNLAIPDLDAIAYAGFPLIAPNGSALGSFCVVAPNPRVWLDGEIEILKDLTAAAMTEIALRSELIERQRIEIGLREVENKYQALFDRSHDAVFIHDFDGNMIELNEAGLRMLGYTTEEIPTLSFRSLMSPRQLPIALAMINDVRRVGYQQEVTEVRLRTKAGIDVYVETMASVIYRDGAAWAIQGIARNVTQRRQAEAALRRAYDKEKELGALRANFISMVSHDFRTPLTVIRSASDLLKQYAEKMSDTQKTKYLDRIQSQIQRLVEMLNDILTISKGESTGLKLTPGQVDWKQLSHELAEEAQHLTDQTHHLAFQYRGKIQKGFADEALIRRAILNLLSNAIKYSPAGGTVTFDIVGEEEYVTIRVQDEGIGIKEDDQKHLFETFYRASNVGAIQGTGLGLAIVKQVIQAHGGTINFESHVGKGTTFVITLPIVAEIVDAGD